MKKQTSELVEVQGIVIEYFKINNTINGTPRIVVHFTELGLNLNDYETANFSFNKYRGKWFGGGYVLQAFDVKYTLNNALDEIQEYLNEKHKAVK